MKNLSKSIALLTLFALFSATSIAQQGKQQQQGPAPMKKMGMDRTGMQMCMGGMHMGMMANMSEEEKEKRLRTKQKHMLKMHDLSNQILTAKDPKEKERLEEEQIQLMKTHMAEMMAKRKMMMQQRGGMQQSNQ